MNIKRVVRNVLNEMNPNTHRTTLSINFDHVGDLANANGDLNIVAERIADAIKSQMDNYGITSDDSEGMIKGFSVSHNGLEITRRKIY